MTGAAGAGAGVSVGWLVAGRADALLAWQVGGAPLLDWMMVRIVTAVCFSCVPFTTTYY